MICKPLRYLFLLTIVLFSTNTIAQSQPFYSGEVSSVEYVSPILSRQGDLRPAIVKNAEAKDKRSIENYLSVSKSAQNEDDYFVKNRHEMEQSVKAAPASIVFDAYLSNSQPTDPSLAVGPNHVMVVFNTGFTIYDKSGTQLLGQTAPNPVLTTIRYFNKILVS